MIRQIFSYLLILFLPQLIYCQSIPLGSVPHAGAGGTSLVGKWLLNEGGAATIALDSSGNANDATWHNSPDCAGSYYTTGIAPLAFSGCFTSGGLEYLIPASSTPYNFDRNNTFTLSVWVNPSTVSGGLSLFSTLDIVTAQGWEFNIANGSLSLYLINTNPGNAIILTNVGTVTANVTQHLCATYDGSSTAAGANVYINGVLQTPTVSADNLSASIISGHPLQISGRNGNSFTYQGVMADARIYNTVTSCTAIYNAGPGG